MEKTKTAAATLNIEELLSSKEFTNIVNQLASEFRVLYTEELKNDLRQVCSIAAWEALQKYNAEKCGGNFWGYAYLRMREMAKREVFEQRNIVHIPMNHIADNAKYDGVAHTYEGLTWEDGHDKCGEVAHSEAINIDIEKALELLNEEDRYIFEVHSELKAGKTEKSDFGSLSLELGIPAHVVRRRFIAAQKTLADFLR